MLRVCRHGIVFESATRRKFCVEVEKGCCQTRMDIISICASTYSIAPFDVN